MKIYNVVGASLVSLLLGVSGMSNAALIDRGSGMIYDSDLNITWLADANYAQTSGYDSDGKMTWSQAMTWAANLSFNGYAGWRLPTAITFVNGYDCQGGEMCHLFTELGGVPTTDIRQTHNDKYALFQNIQGGYYWSGASYPIDTGNALDFNFEGGLQSSDDKISYSFMYGLCMMAMLH